MGKNKKQQQQTDDALGMAHWSGSAYSAAQFSAVSSPPAIAASKKGFFSGGGAVSSSANSTKAPSTYVETPLQSIDHDDLRQGSLYIIKIRNVALSLFEGWDDDMCCFAILRSDSTPMRWSEARYIPGDFDAYDAFDEAGNPPVHLWTRQLRINVPVNWFSIFEEARRKQRGWMEEQNEEYYYPGDNELVQQQQQQQQQQQNHYHNQQPIIVSPGEIAPSVSSQHHPDEEITPPATEKAASNGDKVSETSSHGNPDEVDSISSEPDDLAQDISETEENTPVTEARTVKEIKHHEPFLGDPIDTNEKGVELNQEHPKPPKQKAEPKQQENPAAKPKVPEPAVKTIEPSNMSAKERTKKGYERGSPAQVPSQQIANDTESVASMSRSSLSATQRTVQKKFADNVSSSPVLPQPPAATTVLTSPISSNPHVQHQQQHMASVIPTTKRSSSLPVPAPFSPKSKYQSEPPSSVAASNQLFAEPDFSFSHNADKFSIKKGYDIPPLPAMPPPQSRVSKKSVPAAQQQSAELLKPKRRSVHDLFRGKKDSRR